MTGKFLVAELEAKCYVLRFDWPLLFRSHILLYCSFVPTLYPRLPEDALHIVPCALCAVVKQRKEIIYIAVYEV